MRILVLLFLLMLLLEAKQSESCYSISLLSAVNSSQNRLKLLQKYADSKECKVLEIGKMLSVRCGCYDALHEARKRLDSIQKNSAYRHAVIAPTYRYRFTPEQKKEVSKAKVKKVVKIAIVLDTNKTKKIEAKLAPVSVPIPETVDELHLDKMDEVTQESAATASIDATLIGRYVSNKNVYKHAPYFFALFESEYEADNFIISGGLAYQSREQNEELLINNLEFKYFGDNYTFKIGKMVQKVGVLDYFSLQDTLNPTRAEFFYDTQLNIKKIPLWMSSVDYFVNDSIKLTAFVQPYDAKHSNYRGVYVDYLLNQFIPQYYKDVFRAKPLGEDVFYPVYANSLVPYLQEDINDKSADSKIYLNKLSFGFISEYSDTTKKIGVLYFNKYSEIPMIRVDQNLLDAAIAYDNGKNPSQELVNYATSGDYEPIKSVEDFRYQQYGIYGETTYKSYGFRAELGYRDKIPLFNNYSGLASVGFAVDKLSDFAYNALETEYVYLQRYHKSAYISMLRTRFKRSIFSYFSGYFENSLIAAQIDTQAEYSIAPRYVLSYKDFDLAFEGLLSQNNKSTNTFSLLLRGKF